MQLKLKKIIKYNNINKWCKLPYPAHPNGCPNYNKKKTCPPKALSFEKLIKPPFTLVAVKFNLKEHIKKMKQKHPNWTDKQARCVLYWQNKVNKQLRELSEKTAAKIPNSMILHMPEANGVNLFETCKKVGLILEPNPQNILWKMSIIGIKK
jgi:hypothetical protein